MRITARAKVNWTLAVLGRREDGFHELDTLMQSVHLCDAIEIAPDAGLTLAVAGKAAVPRDGSNLALRAAEHLRAAVGTTQGARILLRKRIPTSAGLGGGSADAAAVLLGLNALWGLGLSSRELKELALGIGADVPFCLCGGLARAAGIGEALTPLTPAKRQELVIVKPAIGLSTPGVFAAYDAKAEKPRNPDTDAAMAALLRGDAAGLARSMGNALEPAAIAIRPEIAQCIQALEHFGALRAQMTGSGSAVIGLFETADAAAHAARACGRHWRQAFCTHTAERGIVLEG